MIDPFDALAERAADLGVHLSGDQVDLLRRHFQLVCEMNRSVNLTRVTEPSEAVEKLYLASLAVFPALSGLGVVPEGLSRYLDLGTGAGFPGLPVAVAAPWLTATLIDGRGKKAAFLEGALERLGLAPRIRALKVRGAEFARRAPGRFDLITARAVAATEKVVGEVIDLLAPGGCLAIHKGPGLTTGELEAGEAEARRQGLALLGVAESEIGELRPRIVVFSRPVAGDEGGTPP